MSLSSTCLVCVVERKEEEESRIETEGKERKSVDSTLVVIAEITER